MSNWTPLNEHLAEEGYDSEGVEAIESMQESSEPYDDVEIEDDADFDFYIPTF
jgi:hypothetical protein